MDRQDAQVAHGDTQANRDFQPELSALRDNLVKYEIEAAKERQSHSGKRQALDHLVVTWRDILHESLASPGAVDMIHMIHKVMDNMDDFLNRQKELYK